MRCLFVADLHYSLPKFDWLAQAAVRYDLVVLAGDALDIASSVDYRVQTLVVRKYLQRIAGLTRLVVCSGNHDLDSKSESGEKVARWIDDMRALDIASDGESIVVDDMLVTICPWWDGPVVRERLVAQLDADSRRRENLKWIWIHHAPPLNSPTSWSGQRSLGDADVVTWIGKYAPDMVVGGHIHQSPFVKDGSWVDRIGNTWVFNVGHELGSMPPHILLETARREAVWISSMGVQTLQMDAPLQRPLPTTQDLPEWLGLHKSPAGQVK